MDITQLFLESILQKGIVYMDEGAVEIIDEHHALIQEGEKQIEVQYDLEQIENGVYKYIDNQDAIYQAAIYMQNVTEEAEMVIEAIVNQMDEDQAKDMLFNILCDHQELLMPYLPEDLDLAGSNVIDEEYEDDLDTIHDLIDEEAYLDACVNAMKLIKEILEDQELDIEDGKDLIEEAVECLTEIYDSTDQCDELIEKFVEENQNIECLKDIIQLSEYTGNTIPEVEELLTKQDTAIYVYKEYTKGILYANQIMNHLKNVKEVDTITHYVEELLSNLTEMILNGSQEAIDFIKQYEDYFEQFEN